MNVPDRYTMRVTGTGNYERVEIFHDLDDLITELRRFRWRATDAHATVTDIHIEPEFIDQAPIPGMVS